MPAAHFADVEHAANIRVRDLPRGPRLLEQALQQRGVTLTFLRQELQRDALAQLEIVGAIDLAHPSSAEQAHDAVPVEQPLAGAEHRVVEESWRRRVAKVLRLDDGVGQGVRIGGPVDSQAQQTARAKPRRTTVRDLATAACADAQKAYLPTAHKGDMCAPLLAAKTAATLR